MTASDPTWSALLRYEATGEGGGIWWRTTEPVAIESADANASLTLELTQAIEEARKLADAAEVPSRLTLSVEVRHEATVAIDGELRTSEHATIADLVPREGFVVVETHEDGSTYSQPVEEGRDWTPVALLGAVLLAEGAVHLHRRRDPSWMHERGVEAVEVTRLTRPTRGHRPSLDTLLRLARNRDQPLLVDEETGIALVNGDPPLWSSIPSDRG